MIDPYLRGELMQSFLRFILMLCLLIAAFVGGWFSSDMIKQDPFLANIFNIKNAQYDRFVRDITNVIQEMRIMDQNQLIEALLSQQVVPSFANLRELDQKNDNTNDTEKDQEANDFNGIHDEEIPNDPTIADGVGTGSVAAVDPNDMLGTIVQQMSAKEKLSFLLWARSRFTDEQIKQIEVLLQDGITADNFLTLYQHTRKSLKGSDYEYLLSFVDRYLSSREHQEREDAIPVFQANEGPR